MAFRFRKSFKLAPGVRLNLSRSGVSTTFGGRGLSMNVSRRGTRVTAGIPGTGISYQARSGGGYRAENGGEGAGTQGGGCLGCGGAAFLLLLMGLCASPDRPSGSPLAGLADTTLAASPLLHPPIEPRETFYLHGAMNLRTGPGKTFDVARTLPRGERVTLGAKDAGGWAPLFDGYGQRAGYVYRASDAVRSYAPAAARVRTARTRTPRHPSGASAVCRDGTYSYSRSRRGTCSWHGGVARWL